MDSAGAIIGPLAALALDRAFRHARVFLGAAVRDAMHFGGLARIRELTV